MKLNTHNYDRILRVVIAIALFVAAAMTGTWLLAVVGVILLATAAMGFCPLYAIIGFSTRRKQNNES